MSLFCLKNKYIHRENENWLSPGGETTCYFDFSYSKILFLSGKKDVLLLSFKILHTNFKQKVCYTSFEFSESQEMWKTLRWEVRRLQAAHKPTASHAGRADSDTGASGEGLPNTWAARDPLTGFQRQPHVLPVLQCSPPTLLAKFHSDTTFAIKSCVTSSAITSDRHIWRFTIRCESFPTGAYRPLERRDHAVGAVSSPDGPGEHLTHSML